LWGHDATTRVASRFISSIDWFEVAGGVAAGKRIMDSVRVWTLADLGSVESLVTHR